LDAYESSKIYIERMKRWHDEYINRREFREDDLVFVFNLRLKLFSHKRGSRWSSPFKVLNIYKYGAIEVETKATGTFKMNGLRIKHYIIS